MKFTVDKKIGLFVTCLILLVGVVFAVYVIGYQTRLLNAELDERTEVLLGYLAASVEYPVLVGDREAIARLAGGVMAQRDIVYCRIETRAGLALYQQGEDVGPARYFSCPIVTRKTAGPEEALILDTSRVEEEEIGRVHLAASLLRLDRRVDAMRKGIVTLVFTAVALALVGMWFLLGKVVGGPVSRLVEATGRIAAGDLESRVPEDSRDEFGLLAESFNRMTASLLAAREELVRKEKLALLGQVAAGVGHELRNPLGVMGNAVFYLQSVLTDADETVKEYLDIIKAEIAGADRIVGDLLDSVRTKPPQPQPVMIRELIEKAMERCDIPAAIEIRLEIPETLPSVEVDSLQIRQVFRNLIANAVDAMPDGGILEIRAGEDKKGENIAVVVRDSGTGMTEEQVGRLYQPLFSTKARGIGLGLVVVKNLTTANGGTVEVTSEPGKGTIFTVTRPCGEGRGDRPVARTA